MCCPNCRPNGQREAKAEAAPVTMIVTAATDPDAVAAAIRWYARTTAASARL